MTRTDCNMEPLENIVRDLPKFRSAAESLREVVIANVVMIGETPAPTGSEGARTQFIVQRLGEYGLENCSTDEKNNGFGFLRGDEGRRTILVMANADTFATESIPATVEVRENGLIGPFVVDNCLGLAAMVSLPALLEKLQLRLKSNLLLMAAARCLGRGNLEGPKHFLASPPMNLDAGICLEGVQVGRLNHACLGMTRGEIACRLPDDYNWAQFGTTGSIIAINDVINQVNKIALPRRPLTTIVFGSIEGGVSYNNIARQTTLRFEVRSESADMLNDIQTRLQEIVEQVAAHSGTRVTLDLFTRRDPGGIDIGHPLVRAARAILSALGPQPMLYPTTSAMSALVDAKIPALTLGITTGERRGDLAEVDELAAVPPIWDGLAQLLGVILAIDGGCCDAA